MDEDTRRRLSAVESSVSEVKAQVTGIAATIPHLATKADVQASETKITKMIGDLDVKITRGQLSLVQWGVGAIVGVAGLAFAIARFIH